MQQLTFCVKNKGYRYIKPKYLLPDNEFRLIEAKVKGSTMVWYVEGETISYNQMKELLKK